METGTGFSSKLSREKWHSPDLPFAWVDAEGETIGTRQEMQDWVDDTDADVTNAMLQSLLQMGPKSEEELKKNGAIVQSAPSLT